MRAASGGWRAGLGLLTSPTGSPTRVLPMQDEQGHVSPNTGRVGGSDPTHWHFETCPRSPLGQAPITSLRHLAPPSPLHPAAAEMSGNTPPAHLAEGLGALPLLRPLWPSALPATPHARLAPCAWGPFLAQAPTRLLSLVLLRRVANSQLPRKAVPNQPYPKPYAPQDPLWPLPPQPPPCLPPYTVFCTCSVLGREHEP